MEQINISIDYEKAEETSKLLYNLFISDFFGFSNAISEDYIDFKTLLKIKDLALYFKALIDEKLDQETDNENSDLIKIALPYETWQRIASACISVADYDLINDEIKEDLRKTYFQIKAETR